MTAAPGAYRAPCLVAFIAAALVLAACGPDSPAGEAKTGPLTGLAETPGLDPQPPPQRQSDTCGASARSAMLGGDIESVDAATLPANRRILLGNAPVSGRIDPTRLSIRVDAGGRVVQLRCG